MIFSVPFRFPFRGLAMPKTWLVTFNPNKTECMTISLKLKKPFPPSLIFDDVHLKDVESHKHPGVTTSSNLSWNLHINALSNKL